MTGLDQLTPGDLAMVVRRLPADLRKLMRQRVLFVAGGFIREVISGGTVHDIDMFGESKDALESAMEELKVMRSPNRVEATSFETKFAYTLLCPPRAPVQFIHKWTYTDPKRLIAELDFTVCQAVVWHEGDAEEGKGNWASGCSQMFYPDLAARRLRYTFPVRAEAAGGSLMRVRKFLSRGYNIQADSLAGVVARLVGGIKAEKLGGLMHEGRTEEQATHLVLKALLHEVDPLLVIDAVEPREEEDAL